MPMLRLNAFFATVAVLLLCDLAAPAGYGDVKDRAVFSLNFEGAVTDSGLPAVADSAKSGVTADIVSLPSGGRRVADLFQLGSGGSSLLLDPAKNQVVSIASSADLSQTAAVTVSGLFANLHAADDNVFRGLFARRQPDGPAKTNYGINFNPAADILQVYVNDGSGFKVVTYTVKNTIGIRRRVHMSAVFSSGDAPGADTDGDADDVRIQLFVNGAAVVPVSAPIADGSSGWLADVALSNCVAETPLTVGGSFLNGEPARIICDEFHVFPEALTETDAAALFRESAGGAAESLAAEQSDASLTPGTSPQISDLSQYALTIAQTGRLTVSGSSLEGAHFHIGAIGLTFTATDDSTGQQANFDVTIPADVVPGRYRMWITTASGVSASRIISIDGLKQHHEGQFTEAAPAVELPVAVSGRISGTEQKRIFFSAKAGQRIVAEVESRRLGSGLDPVVEIKTSAASPLAIQWQQPDLSGDARAVVTLPADGLYFVEVHDLQYRAPAGSFFRLLLGDLPASSAVFPPILTSASTVIRSTGLTGISEPITLKAGGDRVVVESGTSLLPLGAMTDQSGTDITEPVDGSFDAAAVDATFTTAPFRPLFINGRIVKPGETDQVLLTVTPGQALHFSVATRQFSSPLRAELNVFAGDAQVASSNGSSGVAEAAADYTVAEGVTQLRVQIRDFTGRGSAASVYRVQVARKDRPGFQLQARDASLRLPANGSVPLRVSVVRQSPSFRFFGAIRLSVSGVSGVSIVPDQIVASEQNQDVLLMLTRSAAAGTETDAESGHLEIIGQSTGLDPNVSERMSIPLDSASRSSLTFREDLLVSSRAESIPATVLLQSIPPVLFRGIPAVIPVKVLPLGETVPPFVRFQMLTTEAVRRQDPDVAGSPLLPLVEADEFQVTKVSEAPISLRISVPSDVAETTIDAVIGAAFVPQPAGADSGSNAWTAPIRLTVQNAATLVTSADPVKASRLATITVTGTVRRHPQYEGEVSVNVEGLPQGYSAPAVTVAKDQSTFSLALTVPEQAAPGEVPNLSIRGRSSAGSIITPAVPLKVTVDP